MLKFDRLRHLMSDGEQISSSKLDYLNIVVLDTVGRYNACWLADMLKTIDRHRKANLEINGIEMVVFRARTERFVNLLNRRTIWDARHRNRQVAELMHSVATNESDQPSNAPRSADEVLQAIDRLHRRRHWLSRQNSLVSWEKNVLTYRFAYTFEFLRRTFFFALNQRNILCQEMIFDDPTMRKAAAATVSYSFFWARKVSRMEWRVVLDNLSE